MKLQTKAVLAFNFFVVLICACMGVLGYRSADEGFGMSLQMKAESNVQSIPPAIGESKTVCFTRATNNSTTQIRLSITWATFAKGT